MSTSVQTKHEYMTPAQVPEGGADAQAVQPGALLGTWTNVNASTRDIVKVVLAASGTGITVAAFGACTPTPCNWGTMQGIAYAGNVSSGRAVAFTAQFRFSFSQVTLIGNLAGNFLNIEHFTHFTDGSGRSDYAAMDQMKK